MLAVFQPETCLGEYNSAELLRLAGEHFEDGTCCCMAIVLRRRICFVACCNPNHFPDSRRLVACFGFTYTFPFLNYTLGASGTFWIYPGICALGFVYLALRLPENKGKSLEAIE